MGVERDTDADWRVLGETQPYWGVLTHPEYRTENLSPASLETFYRTGVEYIQAIAGKLGQTTGAKPSGRALDFGCGAGRLTEAMTAYADTTGYDISPGMLEKARDRGGNATYVDELPPGPFDWINSFIVFQHIPPERGLALMEQVLKRLALGGHISLHVTTWTESYLKPPPLTGWRRFVRPLIERAQHQTPKTGTIMMYDYDLSEVCRLVNQAGISEVTLLSTDHGGRHGVVILGRKTAK
jgi:SAM-dependent methyltransferase